MKFQRLLTAIALYAFVTAASAVSISGNITFGGVANVNAGAQSVDIVGDTAVVTFANGDLAALFPGIVAYSDFSYANPFVSVTPLWSGGGFSFELTSLNILDDSNAANGFLDLNGQGTLSGAGFDDTVYNWSFSTDASGTIISFSSTNSNVPAPGIALLMAIGLAGIGAATRVRQTS